MQSALMGAQCCSTRVFANAKAGEGDAALSAPFQPGKPQEWRSHAECRQAACVTLLEPAHFCVSGEPTHSTPLQQTTATTEYDANAAARKTVRSGAVYDLDARERRREGVERAGRLRKLSLASVIIGTPGAGEPTNSLSSAAKTSLEQQFYDRRPEVVSCDAIHYTSPEFLSFTFFGGSRKAQYELEARADGADQGGSPWRGKASSSMIEKGAYCLPPALGVAA